MKKPFDDKAVAIFEVDIFKIGPTGEPPWDAEGRVRGTIAMSRALVNAQQGLTLNEKRVMMAAMGRIDSRKSPYLHGRLNGYVSVRVRVDEFAALAALEPRTGEKQASAAYEGLKEGCRSLQTRTLSYMDGPRRVSLNWVWKAVYHDGEGWAEISFSPDLTPHLFMLKQRFVTYKLDFAAGLQSIYSWRLLELLMRERDRGRLLIKLDDFRNSLEIPETYRFADIKRRVVDMAVQELNEKADLIIQWRPVKAGRAVSSLDFQFIQNVRSGLNLE